MTDNEIVKASGEVSSEKIKAIYPHIVVSGDIDKPYYSIQYYDIEKKTMFDCYGSYKLGFVRKWLEEHFEVIEPDIADFINRLQAEKEALIAGQETLQKALAEKNEESENQSQNFAVLVSDHRDLQQSFDNLKGLYEAEKAKVAKAKEKCIGFAKELQTAKKEIERLKEYEDIRPAGCPNCNRGNFSNSKFCSHCGTQLRGKAKER